ncbi:MAG TPA: prolipoprotein diacylglyceryl transferase [Candidatus Egerieimonas intestinavium]|uniref:Phosphatidylglycerol--prolipoprotein diacylglyceryl transferase n=1 Tax=Candidatus Egerieimonas intestinavium TaxID=2840777 RepID=A0A9D1EIN7_9FIRM|nr:prolipoprotein diacylglyceryl transferase [Candidatus Egerieimonas intestinavium]
MDSMIYFPNLGIHLEHVGKSISIFGFPIAYYGIIIVTGMVIALWMDCHEAKRLGENPDTFWDMGMIGILAGVVGARLYYVIFAWDNYKDNLLEIFNLRHGGLAIYGGVIGGFLGLYIFGRIKKLNFAQQVDVAAPCLLIGQIMGRWGNFFNREAFGGYTDGLFAMQLPVSAVRQNEITQQMWDHLQTVNGVDMIQVHPTFLYESLWNLALLIFILLYRKHRKFKGQIFLIYLIGYGLGRAWIEGLRTDQLLLPGVGLPVSQLLSVLLVIVGAALMIFMGRRAKKQTADKEA